MPIKVQDLPDEDLMNHYKAGDFTAFEILYTRHANRVFGYLSKKVSREVARDLVQEIFEKLHSSRDKYNSQYPFLPWLFTISRNTLFDYFKKAETKLAVMSSSTVDSDTLNNLGNRGVAVTGSVTSTEELAKMLEGLPNRQKQAIKLRYLQDWSFEKIASELKISDDNARQLISRGLKKIRLTFAKKGGFNES